MNKIEEYLNSLKPKEVIYLFVSIPIVIFIIYYNFVYPAINEKISTLQKQEKKLKKDLIKISSKIRKLKVISKTLRPTAKKLQNLKEDFKYIKYNIYSLANLNLDNDKVYIILSKLLNQSKQLNIKASFSINWNTQFPPFTKVLSINIEGSGNYVNIINYIRYIESLPNITYITDIKTAINDSVTTKTEKIDIKLLKDSNNIYFNTKLLIMGIK